MKIRPSTLTQLTALVITIMILVFAPSSDFSHQILGTTTTPSPTLPPLAIAISSPVFVASDSAVVVKIIDGDTIKVNLQGKIETVRLVGINTPETVDPRKPVECFGKEASAKLAELLAHQIVTLENDETQTDRDRYGRLLRFVLVNGKDVGLEMLQQGYAQESLYSVQPHKYHASYISAQTQAQKEVRGLWGSVCDRSNN